MAKRKSRKPVCDPSTPAEWQEAVNAADFGLCIDSARQYGLIEATMKFDLPRCLQIIEEGKKRGFHPNWKI